MQRIRFISFLQILGVILVILGHSLHEYPGDFHQFWFYRMFQTVRMPLFVFISGFLFMISMMKKGDSVSFGGFVTNKAQRLLLPYFFLAVVTFVPRSLMSGYADDAIAMNMSSFLESIFFSDRLTIVFLWFLPVIFTMLCIAFVGLRIFKDREAAFFLLGGILALTGYFGVNQWACTFLGIGRIAGLAIFFIIGMVYGRWRNIIDSWLERWWFGGICAALWLGLFYIEDIPDVFRLICSLAGLAMLISFSLIACEWPLGWRHLEGYNYMMYLLSWFTCVASQQILHHFTDFPWWIYTVIALITSVYIPWAIGKLLHHFSPHSSIARGCLFILGHNPRRYAK